MAIKITGTFEPTGDFPLVKSQDIEMPDGTRLSEFEGGVTSVNGQTGAVVIEIPKAVNGEDGRGIAHAVMNQDYTLTIVYTDGTKYTTPVLKGAKGDQGEKGDKGDPGVTGASGVSPAVTVEEITGGHRVSITDASGTQTFDVMDGEDGSGASITVDSELSGTSTNPVQNKAVTAMFATWENALGSAIMPRLMPEVSAADKGKILQVDENGAWAAVAIGNAEGGEY